MEKFALLIEKQNLASLQKLNIHLKLLNAFIKTLLD